MEATILKLILWKEDEVIRTGFIWHRLRNSVGACEEGI
jgi:hypothetical protein